jgi:hypothetical protein
LSTLLLLNLLLILAGPFAVVAPFFAVAQRAGSPSRSWSRPQFRAPALRLAVA